MYKCKFYNVELEYTPHIKHTVVIFDENKPNSNVLVDSQINHNVLETFLKGWLIHYQSRLLIYLSDCRSR